MSVYVPHHIRFGIAAELVYEQENVIGAVRLRRRSVDRRRVSRDSP